MKFKVRRTHVGVRYRLLVLHRAELVDVVPALTLAVQEDSDTHDATKDEASERRDDQVVHLEPLSTT